MAKQTDHLDNEVSIKGRLTESGGELRAKSRLVSGLDRLGGNFAELLNAPMERRAARIRGEIKLIEASVAAKVARVRANPELADVTDLKSISSNTRRLANESESIVVALEDLSARPPTEEQQTTGPERLSDEFLDRWERYAEDASTDELRAKWGKVLAAEIRQPGRISRRTMRAVDELPAALAVRFEELCRHRLGPHLLKCLTQELSFEDVAALSFYGLIVDPGLAGHVAPMRANTVGAQVWLFVADERALGLPLGASDLWAQDSNVLLSYQGEPAGPAIPVYRLTDVGLELASIFEDNTEAAWQGFIAALAAVARTAGGCVITEYRRSEDRFRHVGSFTVVGEEKPST